MIEHGTRACYQAGCRNEECRKANAEYMRGYNRFGGQRGTGTVRLPDPPPVAPTTDWMDRANCKGVNTDVFFPSAPQRVPAKVRERAEADAKQVCRACEVRAECLEYARRTEQTHGIWGGLSPRERRRLWI